MSNIVLEITTKERTFDWILDTKDVSTIRSEINSILDDAEAIELNVGNVLEYVSYDKTNDLFAWLTTKLRKQGKLVLSGNDATLWVFKVNNCARSIAEFNNAIFGNNRRSILSLSMIKDWVDSRQNLTMLSGTINENSYRVEVQRV